MERYFTKDRENELHYFKHERDIRVSRKFSIRQIEKEDTLADSFSRCVLRVTYQMRSAATPSIHRAFDRSLRFHVETTVELHRHAGYIGGKETGEYRGVGAI